MKEKHKKTNQIEKRFIKPLKGPFVLSVITLAAGILYLLWGGLLLFADFHEYLWSGISIMILGIGHIPYGIWGISSSKKQDIKILPGTNVVYYDWMDRAIYRCSIFGVWVLSSLMSVMAGIACMATVKTGMILGLSAILFFFCSFYLVSALRKHIELYGDIIYYVNAFGKASTYHKSEIKCVLQNAPVRRYRYVTYDGYAFMDLHDKRLFMIDSKMKNASAFVGKFEDQMKDYDGGDHEFQNGSPEGEEHELQDKSFAEEKHEPQDKSLEEKSFQAKHVEEIWIASRILLIADVVLGLVIDYIYSNTDWMGGRLYYLIMGLIPFTVFAFAWIFRDVVLWGTEEQKSKKKSQKHSYVDISLPALVILLFYAFFVGYPLLILMHCTEGSFKMILISFVIFVLLFGISAACAGWKNLKRGSQWIIMLVFAVMVSIGTTDVIFYETSGTPVHYPAEITETSTRHSGRSSRKYYAQTILRDGTEESISISKTVYDAVNQGEEAVVCERKGILGTEFVTIHLP